MQKDIGLEERYIAAENWEHKDTFANIYNRMILHRCHIPHSGTAGWGTDLTNGRMFQTFFSSTLGPMKIKPVSLKYLGI